MRRLHNVDKILQILQISLGNLELDIDIIVYKLEGRISGIVLSLHSGPTCSQASARLGLGLRLAQWWQLGVRPKARFCCKRI